MPAYPKNKPFRSDLLRKLAQYVEYCTMCDEWHKGEIVYCHIGKLSDGKGTSQKGDDSLGVYGCMRCHNIIDGRDGTKHTIDEVKDMENRGLRKTLKWLFNNDHLEVKP